VAVTRVKKPIKVAVIGGGCGAIAAAFELSRPKHRGRYAVTVYQLGWRLGGKAASGRGPSGRIEEHGLHVWLGFYDNAFWMLRECYAELAARPGRFDVADWRAAFLPEANVGLFAGERTGHWRKWSAYFPPHEGLPGDALDPGAFFSLSYYLGRAIGLLRTLILDLEVSRHGPGVPSSAQPPSAPLPERISALLAQGVFASAVALCEALAVLQSALALVPALPGNGLVRLAETIARSLRNWVEESVLADHRDRHIWEIIDLVVAIVVGSLRFGLLTHPRGLEAIDDYECREWLLLNGASERSVWSPFVCGLYDLALAYEDGDPSRPGLAAGQALRGSLRMFFGYRGALFWRMRASMGDVFFAPLYEALKRRGVRFAFFHKLRNVGLGWDGPNRDQAHVASLEFDIQARLKAGTYEPLIEVAGRPCWPSAPDYSQLEDGERLSAGRVEFGWDWEERGAGASWWSGSRRSRPNRSKYG
jgi:uncharacterized protein with NAD-binding domain and iron-sulfur cluster